MHAAKLLGSLQTETAVPDLVRLLADPNSYVKDTAIGRAESYRGTRRVTAT